MGQRRAQAQQIGKRLSLIRADREMSQEQFAELVGLSRLSIVRNETGEASVSTDTILRLVELGYNANWLLLGYGHMKLQRGEINQQLENWYVQLEQEKRLKHSPLKKILNYSPRTSDQPTRKEVLKALDTLIRALQNKE